MLLWGCWAYFNDLIAFAPDYKITSASYSEKISFANFLAKIYCLKVCFGFSNTKYILSSGEQYAASLL